MAALLDHFRPPVSLRRHWHAFHHAWATYIAEDLNARLPEGYFAEPNVQFGIEIDVAAFDDRNGATSVPRASPVLFETAHNTWTAPAPTLTLSFPILTDVVEVLVYDETEGPNLAGAIELVSPANKDRPAHREAFVSKCATLLQQGVGVIVVDVVTERRASLHSEFLARYQSTPSEVGASELYVVSYRPVSRSGETSLDIWEEPLQLGRPLPTVPIGLRGGLCLPVDLDTTYDHTRQKLRISAAVEK